MLIKSLWAKLKRTRIKPVSGTNNYFKFDLDGKLNPNWNLNHVSWWVLDMVTKQQNRKYQSVSAIFLIYSIFSNRNQISLFSRKACDKFITMSRKKWGTNARWWATAISQLTELIIKANPPCFQYARCKWRESISYTSAKAISFLSSRNSAISMQTNSKMRN